MNLFLVVGNSKGSNRIINYSKHKVERKSSNRNNFLISDEYFFKSKLGSLRSDTRAINLKIKVL